MGDKPTLTQSDVDNLIDCLAVFAKQKMRANLCKGHWGGMSQEALVQRAGEEFGELLIAITSGEHPDEVWKEAGDVANIVAMMADNYEANYGERTSGVQES